MFARGWQLSGCSRWCEMRYWTMWLMFTSTRDSRLLNLQNILWFGLDSTVPLPSGRTSNTELRVVLVSWLSTYQLLRDNCLIRAFQMNFIISNPSAYSRKNSTSTFIDRSWKIYNQFFHKEEGWYLRTMIAFWHQKNINLWSYNSYQSILRKIGKV